MAKPHLDWDSMRPAPFVQWLNAHGLLHRGCSWECTTDPATGQQTYRRYADHGKLWPAEKIAGGLIVRPKRPLELT